MIPIDPLLRVAGHDAPLSDAIAGVQARLAKATVNSSASDEEYALIDPLLTVESSLSASIVDTPAPGLSYAAFSPRQRGWFLAWQSAPLTPAPRAFQQLYLANLEVRLLEGAPSALHQLEQLLQSDAWTSNPAVWRVALLAAWLAQDGAMLATWLAVHPTPGELTGVALGMQALLGAPLSAAATIQVARTWQHPAAALSETVLVFRLQSLATALGQEPLQRALAQLDAAALTPRPWHCQHRNLRIELPQPDIRRPLEVLLTGLAQVTEAASPQPIDLSVAATADSAAERTAPDELSRAHLILEFRQSRSEFFAIALRQAQKRAGFMQLLDEDRHVVYRVAFRRNEMNAFWQLWNYVQNWTGTRVYREGQELQKAQVYPYSQYLR